MADLRKKNHLPARNYGPIHPHLYVSMGLSISHLPQSGATDTAARVFVHGIGQVARRRCPIALADGPETTLEIVTSQLKWARHLLLENFDAEYRRQYGLY